MQLKRGAFAGIQLWDVSDRWRDLIGAAQVRI